MVSIIPENGNKFHFKTLSSFSLFHLIHHHNHLGALLLVAQKIGVLLDVAKLILVVDGLGVSLGTVPVGSAGLGRHDDGEGGEGIGGKI